MAGAGVPHAGLPAPPPPAPPPPAPPPPAPPAGGGGWRWRGPALTATRWGAAGLCGGAAAALAVAAPFYPADDGAGWEQLGWFVLTLAAAATVAVAAGAACVLVGLRRGGHPHATATSVAFVPVAVLLGAVGAGVGALAAPAVAHWLVAGFTASTGGDGGGPQTTGPAGWGAAGGLAQRLVVVLTVCGLTTALLLDRLGHRLGGLDRSELLVWAACLPVLVLVPAVLLRGVVRPAAGAALVVAMAGATALAVPSAVATAHPSPARLSRLTEQLPRPEGFVAVSHDQAVTSRFPDATQGSTGPDRLVLVDVLAVGPAGGPAPAVPAALRPDGAGVIPWPGVDDPVASGVDLRSTPPVPSTATGRAAASRWEQLLLADGWERVDGSGVGDGGTAWLPPAVRRVVDGRPRLARGPWLRATVVPAADGAVLVVSTRP